MRLREQQEQAARCDNIIRALIPVQASKTISVVLKFFDANKPVSPLKGNEKAREPECRSGLVLAPQAAACGCAGVQLRNGAGANVNARIQDSGSGITAFGVYRVMELPGGATGAAPPPPRRGGVP